MIKFEKFLETTREDLKAGKEISFQDRAFNERFEGETRSAELPASWCENFHGWASEYFREECQSKHHSIRGIWDETEPDSCVDVEIPFLAPSLSLRWGDSNNDQIETEDIETFCFTARNPYRNVTFNSFEIATSMLLDPNWNIPPDNNDGSPSSKFTPAHKICFGDIGPCSSVSREIQLVNRNAFAGVYHWFVLFCSNWSARQAGIEGFRLNYEQS